MPENVTCFPPVTPFQPTEELLPTERNVILGISILSISTIKLKEFKYYESRKKEQ